MSKTQYELVRAIRDCGGLTWEYRVKDGIAVGRLIHDEDVYDYSHEDIRRLTREKLGCADDVEIEIIEA